MVEPLKLLFELVFYIAFRLFHNAGLSIIAMSLTVNLLLLPLYFRADALEREQKNKKQKMEPWVNRIKRIFKGDERTMMLSAYYRENNYKTTDVLKESVSLFLQIPFFIAAYSFLSSLNVLHGISLGPIKDLGSPDGLFTIGAVSINVLPIFMTLINIISGFIYSDKGQIKEKLKLILIALVFLLLLYNSPSGLVFYWTLNNLFSLGKNIVTGIIKPSAVKPKSPRTSSEFNFKVMLVSCVILALITGLWIPSDVVAENPIEISNTFSTVRHNPTLYLVSSILIGIGTFIIWIPLFFYLLKDKLSKRLNVLMPAAALTGVVNYVLFNKNFGFLTKRLTYQYSVTYTWHEILINILAIIAVALIITFLYAKLSKFFLHFLAIILAVVCLISVTNLVKITVFTVGHNYSYSNTADDVVIPLTTTGQNVIVIMMDRMMGAYVPFLFNERPDVAMQFDGFTYYPNTVSFGRYTNFGAPALYGGYEYTPERINARSSELLKDKHNEALLILPTIFADNDWNVTVVDPPYANYEWIPDVSIYDDMENVSAFQMGGVFNDSSELLSNAGEEYEIRLNRNLFCYGVMKILPYFLQPSAYCDGNYCYMNFYLRDTEDITYGGESFHAQRGIYEDYISQYLALEALSDVVNITDDPDNCFFLFTNGTTHDACHLQEPEYLPAVYVDNTEYDAAHQDRLTVNGVTMNLEDDYMSYADYQTCMAACISLGRWFDYLRANNLYDNTRIIIVADHGNDQGSFEELLVPELDFNAQCVNPVLMVKDFGSSGFTVSEEFMTNADTPTLALDEVINNPINPYTGNPIVQDKTGDQLIYISSNLNVLSNNGYQFEDPDGYWLTVRDNIFDDDNWHFYSSAS
ncbi:MAG: YidC/Oxa1 family membrane protein insertase [Clostridiales bacterium]|nr:YidC/Oxa1 family membrane protein insertase [Clostridiales bacterium]